MADWGLDTAAATLECAHVKAPVLLVLFSCFFVGVSRGELTPLDAPLAEETSITITCALTNAPKRGEIAVLDLPKDPEQSLGTYQYRLWLPTGYLSETNRQWPCLFVMAPGGNPVMGPMKECLRTNGFVVVMLVQARNGPWAPIMGNFLAAHDDVVKRVRIAEGRKYATGMSGGARGSSMFVQSRPGFGGLILQAAGLAYGDNAVYHASGLKRDAKLRIAMTMGTGDANRNEVARVGALFPKSRFKAFEFEGPHTWAPAATFEQALMWVMRSDGTGSSVLPR